jgi:hypothetical protein
VFFVKSGKWNVKTVKIGEEESELMTRMPVRFNPFIAASESPKLSRKNTKKSPPLSFSCPL